MKSIHATEIAAPYALVRQAHTVLFYRLRLKIVWMVQYDTVVRATDHTRSNEIGG